MNEPDAAANRLEGILFESANFGSSVEITSKDIEQKRQQLIAPHANKTEQR